MNRARILLLVPAALALAAQAQGPPFQADSSRGAKVFETLDCIQCHSVNGRGGTTAPDLGRLVDRNFTPASLAATMWNHAPTMWSAMRGRGIQPGDLNDQAAADLFAYFYSARFFDKPGDAARGKQVFSSKHCADCHGLTAAKLPAAKPVSQWESIGHPIVLVDAMWNHAATMREEFARRKLPWAELTSQELTDLLVYLRNLPGERGTTAGIEITSGAKGATLFQSKGCAACHAGGLELTSRLKNMTLTDIAVAMWNHEPKMTPTPGHIDIEEMRELVSYLWAGQFFADSGNPAGGARIFASKHCVTCHNDASSGAPALPAAGQTFTGATMVSALWRHGTRMLGQMKNKSIAWPHFDAREMSDTIAYLDSKGGGK